MGYHSIAASACVHAAFANSITIFIRCCQGQGVGSARASALVGALVRANFCAWELPRVCLPRVSRVSRRSRVGRFSRGEFPRGPSWGLVGPSWGLLEPVCSPQQNQKSAEWSKIMFRPGICSTGTRFLTIRFVLGSFLGPSWVILAPN